MIILFLVIESFGFDSFREQIMKAADMRKRSKTVINTGAVAGITKVIHRTLQMLHFFLGVPGQERGSTFEGMLAAPGAHLLIKQ
ncbi:hypothetical protein HmCmsJML020_03734 [Escherichia coli]|nr:hypothetical protein HmCmsJML020_03734 [Escherichia coli]